MLGVKIRPAEDEDAKPIEDMVSEWLKWKIERVKTFREAPGKGSPHPDS